LFAADKLSKYKDIGKGRIISVICLEVGPNIMCSLEFGNFAEDFIGHILDNYKEYLLLRELDAEQLLRRSTW
jgi:hypothetical protein